MDYIDLMKVHLASAKFFQENAIDPSIAPMISEDDENALPDKNGRSFS
jgi:hypothetical protein